MYIKVRVIAGSRIEEIIKNSADHYIIRVREKAVRNMANTRLLEILNEMFPDKSVRIIHGHHESSKLVAIED